MRGGGQFATARLAALGAGDAETFSPCGQADLTASAALRAIRRTHSTATWPDALRLQPARLVKCPG